MSDIVEELRQRTDYSMMLSCDPPRPAPDRLCHEAADEIERLRAALRTIAHGKRDADQSYATLFAEVVREARAALPSRDHLAAFEAALSPAPSEGGDAALANTEPQG